MSNFERFDQDWQLHKTLLMTTDSRNINEDGSYVVFAILYDNHLTDENIFATLLMIELWLLYFCLIKVGLFPFMLTKAATGSCSKYVKCSRKYNLGWKNDLFCWNQINTGKIRNFVKNMSLAWDIDVFWILIERLNSEHPQKFRYSCERLPRYRSSCPEMFLGILQNS